MGCPHMDVLHSKRRPAEGFVEAACTQLPGLLGVDLPLWKNSMREGRSWQPVNFSGAYLYWRASTGSWRVVLCARRTARSRTERALCLCGGGVPEKSGRERRCETSSTDEKI